MPSGHSQACCRCNSGLGDALATLRVAVLAAQCPTDLAAGQTHCRSVPSNTRSTVVFSLMVSMARGSNNQRVSSSEFSSPGNIVGIGEAAHRLARERSGERVPPHAAVLSGRRGVLRAEARRIEIGRLTVRAAETVQRLLQPIADRVRVRVEACRLVVSHGEIKPTSCAPGASRPSRRSVPWTRARLRFQFDPARRTHCPRRDTGLPPCPSSR